MTSLQSGNYPIFTNPQKLGLEAIANACPLSDGPGVYISRQILTNLGFSAIYNDSVNCLVPPSPAPLGSFSSVEELINYKIVPNPVINQLQLIGDRNNITKLEILNSLRITILVPAFNESLISTSELYPGIYLLQIVFSDGSKKSLKFIKQ